ncbi:MAG: protein-L-isoaspartate(D-aspartate) O-methyltransferase [Rhodospirillales bacterium]
MTDTDDRYTKERARLLEEIAEGARETAALTGRARFSDRVMRAIAAVPRHEFVAADQQAYAYFNRPLSIGRGQTISQPFIVAVMTELLDLEPGDSVLEVGTGCGYQAAVLAELVERVYSVETIAALATAARERLEALGYDTVDIRIGDGFEGWPEKAPFDAIIVTAAPTEIPGTLIEQMKPGGRLVIPIGPQHDSQTLFRCVKESDGRLSAQRILPVAFVPMIKGPEN